MLRRKKIKENYFVEKNLSENVFLGIDISKNDEVAIKCIPLKEYQNMNDLNLLKDNLLKISSQNNINLVKHIDFTQTKSNAYFIMELLKIDCNLEEYLHKNKNIPEEKGNIFCNQILNALEGFSLIFIIFFNKKSYLILINK